MKVDSQKAARHQIMEQAAASVRKMRNFIDHVEKELKSLDEPTVKMALVSLKALDNFMTQDDGLSKWMDEVMAKIKQVSEVAKKAVH